MSSVGPPPSLMLMLMLLLHVSSLFRSSAVAADRRYDHHVLGTSMAWPEPYDPRAVIHSRFQVTRDGRVLLASPRFRPGVPFTLGSFRATAASRAIVEPDVRPLPPNPRLHRIDVAVAGTKSGDKAGAGAGARARASAKAGAEAEARDELSTSQPQPPPLINVVDLCLDVTMDVLWLLDVGVVDTMTDSPKRIAPAKIVRLEIDENDDDTDCIFDPKTPYRTFELKTDGEDASCLQYMATFRSRDADGDHYAFVSDAARCAVLVLNTDTGDQWSVDFPERTRTADVAAADVMFMVLLRTADGRAALYVTFMSGCRVYAVDLERLDRCSAAEVAARPSVVEVGRKPYRIAVLGTDAGGRMYFRRPAENEIWTWHVDTPFHPADFRLVSVGRDCRAPVHVAPGYGGFVFVLANNFADYARNGTGSLGAYTVVRPVSVMPPPPPPSQSADRPSTAAAPTDDDDDDADCRECPA